MAHDLDRLREVNRRAFLQGGFAALATFLGLGCGSDGGGGGGGGVSNIGNLGPLMAADGNGVRLPAGFTSRIVAQSGLAPVMGGPLWHPAPDGGACFATGDGGWIYVSNCEASAGSGGGARALRFDSAGNIVTCTVICSGTNQNCAGGKMPWGRWLTCEESGETGRVWECDPAGAVPAIVRPALGRFNHEAVAWDATQGRLYLTEDRSDGGFYRFIPSSFISPGVPDFSAGTLQVAQVAVNAPEGAVTWLTVPDPDGSPTFTRYQVARTPFNGGEGIVAQNGVVHFATKGDNRIRSYNVATQQLVIIYDDNTSPTPILTGVDNIEISADGDLLVAEDGGDNQVVAITPSGAVVPVLQLVGHSGSEVTGPAFDPSRTRLYFSSQRGTSGSSSNGMTFEVTGPFVV